MENPFNYYQPDRGNFKGLLLNCNSKLPIGYLMAESNKEIHIVFQVLNFIFGWQSDDYALLPFHRLLLIALARHKGIKGIYPSIATLAKELKVSTRYVKSGLLQLEYLKLITIDRDNGRSSRYYLDFLQPTEHLQITGDPQFTGEPQITPPSICSSPHRASVVHPINTEEELKRNNRESARKKLAPLSLDFLPDQKTKDEVKALGFSKEEALEVGDAFMEYFLDSGEARKNWQFEARKWFRRERDMIDQKSSKGSSPQVTPHRGTTDTRQPEPEQKFTEPARCKEFMKEILGKMNGKGGRNHGILGNVSGDEKAN